MNQTSLLDIFNEEHLELVQRDLNYKDDEEDLLEFFYDSMNSLDQRVNCLREIQKKNLDLCIESINKILGYYNFVFSSINDKLIKKISLDNFIDINLRKNCIESIYNYNKDDAYDYYNNLIKEDNFYNVLPVPIQIETLKVLMETDKNFNDTLDSLTNILTNDKYECEYRYKTLFNLSKNIKNEIYKLYVYKAYLNFINCKNVYTRYKILAAQYLLQNKGEIINETLSLIASFATDKDLDYNLRADAADLLVRLGNDEYKDIGRDIIILLGKEEGGVKTVYNNLQNVHNDDIENSVKNIILDIAGIKTKENENGKLFTFQDIYDKIRKQYNDDKVNSSLLRISLDQTIYHGGQTISSLFVKIYTIIQEHPLKEDLEKRLIEELIDMADTCSSGHLSRLVNVFSGYEVNGKMFLVSIGWKDQIKSNLFARLTTRIKEDKYYRKCLECNKMANYNSVENRIPLYCKEHKKEEMINYNYIEEIDIETMRERILEELTSNGNIHNKKTLSFFFKENLLNIREEMIKEFVPEYLNEELFEEFFRSAISEFEGES